VLWSDSACPTTGQTRLFEHRSNCCVRPVNAGSATCQVLVDQNPLWQVLGGQHALAAVYMRPPHLFVSLCHAQDSQLVWDHSDDTFMIYFLLAGSNGLDNSPVSSQLFPSIFSHHRLTLLLFFSPSFLISVLFSLFSLFFHFVSVFFFNLSTVQVFVHCRSLFEGVAVMVRVIRY
jgi:hypothetical protein